MVRAAKGKLLVYANASERADLERIHSIVVEKTAEIKKLQKNLALDNMTVNNKVEMLKGEKEKLGKERRRLMDRLRRRKVAEREKKAAKSVLDGVTEHLGKDLLQ